jgi:hypothetical protein
MGPSSWGFQHFRLENKFRGSPPFNLLKEEKWSNLSPVKLNSSSPELQQFPFKR